MNANRRWGLQYSRVIFRAALILDADILPLPRQVGILRSLHDSVDQVTSVLVQQLRSVHGGTGKMHYIPTRIAGVQIAQDATKSRSDVQQIRSRNRSVREYGLTREPEYFLGTNAQRKIHCSRGELFVVAVDARFDSETFGQWQCFYLRPGRTIRIPSGVALGWQVTSDDSRFAVAIQSEGHAKPKRRFAIRWDDPELGICWPESPTRILRTRNAAKDLMAIPDWRLPRRRLQRVDTLCAQRDGVWYKLPESKVKPAKLNCRRSPKAVRQQTTSTSILVIGSSGQLGRDLCRQLRQIGPIIGACRTPERMGVLPVPTQVDVSRPASIREAIRRVRPQLIVNATGLTDAERAEKEPRIAQLVNANAPALMADEANRIGAGLIHFCTDKVFDGSGERPWGEDDTPNPQSQYGRTKLLGTQAIQESGVPHLILRSGWLYSTHGDNFVRSISDLITYRSSLTLASDYVGSPTSTDQLARLIAELLPHANSSSRKGELSSIYDWLKQHGGLYHISSLGYASRVDVGDQIVATCRQLGLPVVLSKIHSSSVDDLPGAIACPKNCRLDSSKIALKFGLSIPRWQHEIARQIGNMFGRDAAAQLSVA